MRLIALVTMAEAEGEPIEGKRLVIDVILNRIDAPQFPDTAYDVIWERNQFTCMTNGRVDQCCVKDDILQLVREEVALRTNSQVIFFTTKNYIGCGTPLFQVGAHFFSGL